MIWRFNPDTAGHHGSEILEQLSQDEELKVVGAKCPLDTGVIEFFEAAPR